MYYFEFDARIGVGMEDVLIQIRFDRDEDTTFDREVLSIEKKGIEISGCFSTEFLDELAKKGADLYMAEIACGERDV